MARDIYKTAGGSTGFLLGIVLERRFVKFSVEGKLYKKVIRLAFGFFGYYLLDLLINGYVSKILSGMSNDIV